MSTRSLIGMEVKEGKILAAYCHFDGYPSHSDEKDYLKRCGMIDDLYLWKNDKWYVASKKRFVELISFLIEFE